MCATPAGAPATGDVADQLRRSWQLRPRTDYVFSFRTALAWMVVTLGFYWYYTLFQMMRRIGAHNARRHDLLEAAATMTWHSADAAGRSDELRPEFEQIGADLARMRQVATNFRDPFIWLVLSLLTFGIAGLVAYVLMDGDLVAHEEAEAAVETGITAVMERLEIDADTASESATPAIRARHRYAARFVVLVLTLGVYGLWWTRDMMVDGNIHFARNSQSEDAMVAALRELG